MKKLLYLFLVLGLFAHTSFAQELISKWSFDQFKNTLVSENTTNKTDQLLGFYDSVSGVRGNAIWLDGYTSYIKRDKFGQNLPNNFTITAWVMLEAYPWFRCPVFDLRINKKEGVFLSIKRDGTLTAGFGQPINWIEIDGPRLPLKEWVMVSLVVNQNGLSSLYLNDKKN